MLEPEISSEKDTLELELLPSGKIKCYITGKIKKDNPEEHVRQKVARSLVEEYGYSKEDIEIEFKIKMGTKRKKADIVIFDKNKPHKQENVFLIVESKREDIKPSDKKEGIEQLKSYMAPCANCKYGMWVGSEVTVFEKVMDKEDKYSFSEVVDIPREGVEASNLTFNLLVPATEGLRDVFKRCHNYIHTNQGISKEKAFHEFLKLIFCKVHDEKGAYELDFYITNEEKRSEVGQRKLKKRIDYLFYDVKETYDYIFESNENINLEKRVLAYIVSELQKYTLIGTASDFKGEAYEQIVGSNLRGDRGEFFTPRNLCEMAVEMVFSLIPENQILKQKILDPACGTGGFLKTVIDYHRNIIRNEESRKWKDDTKLLYNVDERVKDICNNKIFGIDFNPELVRAAQMNLVMHGDGSSNILHANSLVSPNEWNEEVRKTVAFGDFDIIFTNPPFGENLAYDDPHILDMYELSNYGAKNTRNALPPEQLFFERCYHFLKPGGFLVIVAPDNILSNPGLKFIRRWLLTKFDIISSIYLPQEMFEPSVGAQTSLMIMKKKEGRLSEKEKELDDIETYNVFMAIASKIGHDQRGNSIILRDGIGNEIYRKVERTLIKRLFDGTNKIETFESDEPVLDDDLPFIAIKFKEWIKNINSSDKLIKNISFIPIPSKCLLEGENRLDATFYNADAFKARKILKESDFELKTIDNFTSNVFNPPQIKRIFTEDLNIGTGYMQPSEMFNFVWSPKKYVIADKMADIDDWYIKEGWVVVTQSGSAGKPFFVTKGLEDIVLSQNAIRIVPDENDNSGYLYAYLSTWIGQTLLKKDEFGVTVKHIQPHHVASVIVPEIDKDKQKIIHKKIKKAFELREQANRLIKDAKNIIYDELDLEKEP
ncbi:N-6 DNA methylase [Methanobacterium formicicum]|uniref:N-6 DNA methylase n=1 Tax=Methanobacterium formicicum TaxID=2162 RepID=UPI002412BA6C|nr:N-6 DNA methylase [Methanobacterium formicicum]MDG3548489.1 N-6 DNA methylase [Methanobacterium formicicum]